MNENKINNPVDLDGTAATRAELIEHLARIRPIPARLRSPEAVVASLERGKTRGVPFQRKQRLVLRTGKRAALSQLSGLPLGPDPLMP